MEQRGEFEKLGRVGFAWRWLLLLVGTFLVVGIVAAINAASKPPSPYGGMLILGLMALGVLVEAWLAMRRLRGIGASMAVAIIGFVSPALLAWGAARASLAIFEGGTSSDFKDEFTAFLVIALVVGGIYRGWLLLCPNQTPPASSSSRRARTRALADPGIRMERPGPISPEHLAGRVVEPSPPALEDPPAVREAEDPRTAVPQAGSGLAASWRALQELGATILEGPTVESVLPPEARTALTTSLEPQVAPEPTTEELALLRWKPLILLGSFFAGAYLGMSAARAADGDYAPAGAIIGAVVGVAAAWGSFEFVKRDQQRRTPPS